MITSFSLLYHILCSPLVFLSCLTFFTGVMMMVWSPWSLAATASSPKFRVRVRILKLEGLEDEFWREKMMMVGVNWRGEGKFVLPFSSRSRRHKEFSSERILKMGRSWLEWDDEEFENSTPISQGHKWDVSFSILYRDAKGKMVVAGKGCLNLAKSASEQEFPIERKIPINLRAAESPREATLSVLVSFAEIRHTQDARELIAPKIPRFSEEVINGRGQTRLTNQQNTRRAQSARFDSESLGSRLSLPGSGPQLDQAKKVPLFSWKRLKSKVERLSDNKLGKDGDRIQVDQQLTSSSTENADDNGHFKQEFQSQTLSAGKWHEMDLVSRDGQTKLVVQVFLASFDQCSCKAAGESACTTLVAVISHWLFSNHDRMPTGTEFDSLIIDGSSEWRKLCDNEPIVNNFPDKHFDLETVLETGIRPVLISQEKSFVGFFSPEKFESLKGAMSFDEIWNEIGKTEEENQPRTYIVSWKDHFFVFKADNEAYYIIDTLGERLYEGCKQAFILKFDKSTLMLGRTGKENVHTEEITTCTDNFDSNDGDEVICKGKDCCREFIKIFLAAIPLRELELEEEKETVSYYSLHQRLQIEFNFITLSSLSSPSLSSQSSDATVSASSLFSNKNDSE
ncbi:hypothetical protein DCAR_0101458 [Daucus carota subsp. sativus]|uniref:C2 NT-type domain-containing protein n=1 Tax=Daucus carota subsp. sativus TaxID=79200 RepID=A0AAF0W2Z2_DAUCS|nr:hypothetical protein DCAR_0101458 [Daucus carota subsp. sativus]